MSRSSVGTRFVLVARAIALLGVIGVGIPLVLVRAARARFGGGAPFHGVPSPADWSVSNVRQAFTDRLTDQTIADIVIRLALVVAWVGVVVIIVTVIVEIVHMVRYDGLHLPDARGLGFAQRTARVIASGLMVLVPVLTTPSTAVATPDRTLLQDRPAGAVAELTGVPEEEDESTPEPVAADVSPSSDVTGRYVVQPGDSIFGIAERMVGGPSGHVAAFAEQLVDVNWGRRMPDGRQFDNAAFIDVGWVLELPPRPSGAAAVSAAREALVGSKVHVVDRGESLWSIAEAELGDATRWPEVLDANEGRRFADGRVLSDPDVIQPGWDLDLPGDGIAVVDAPAVEVMAPDADLSVPSPIDVPTEPSPLPPAPEVLEVLEFTDAGGATDSTRAPEWEERAGGSTSASARRVNTWEEVGGLGAVIPDVPARTRTGELDDLAGAEADAEPAVPALVSVGSAAMLSSGVLTLLAVRRRRRLRRARTRVPTFRPDEISTSIERALRANDTGERFDRVDTAIRSIAVALAGQGRRVDAVVVGSDGELEMRLNGGTELPAPWEGSGDSWTLAASTPLELLAASARAVGVTCPTLVQLGTDEQGRDVYVDLEALEAIEVGGPGEQADAIVAAVAATLAASPLAEVTTLVGVGVPDEAFLHHRRYVPVRDGRRAFEAAADAIGSTAAMSASTFELRVGGTATETWEPAVVLAGAAAGLLTLPTARNGLAVVSAAPIHGPSGRLAPEGDSWVLQPADIRLTPVGLTRDDIGAIARLVQVADAVPAAEEVVADRPALETAGLDEEHTLVPGDRPSSIGSSDFGAAAADTRRDADTMASPRDGVVATDSAVDGGGSGDVSVAFDSVDEVVVASVPPYELLVRMIGPVDVVDRDGTAAGFERSKTRELIAWLATHRDRSTRSAARTALWELDVRDATFANVVSEARRSLARLVDPPEGEEWVGRTMTDALPLHELVVSDADLIEHAVETARLQPPAQAIATLSPAVELIAGVPFQGTSYLWPDSEGLTSNLVLLATTATTELAAHCLSTGDIEGVFRATGRGLQVLPGHEELIGLRMEAYARAGDHAGVRQEWESYERVINGDPWSDGEPAPKLLELRHRLLHPSR